MGSDINKLLNSLSKYPGYMVMHFTEDESLIENLKDFAKEAEEYRVFTFTPEAKEKLKKHMEKNLKIQLVNPKRAKYHNPSKVYDYLFVTYLPKDLGEFFKKVYGALKNGAPVFIFLDLKDRDKAYKIESLLIDYNFVATNIFSVDSYLVVSSKKMHGWSGS